jgi:replicative DNA helicase
VVFFQLEMMQSEMIDTFAAIRSGIPYSSIKTSRFETPDQYALYRSVMGDIVRWQNAYIDCTPAITPSYVLQKCLTLRHQLGGLDGVFIDYIGLMNSDDRKELNRDRIAAITRVIKSHAKTLDAPIIQAAQLSRAVEMRGVVRPQLSDLAESGTIEQDSDAVFAFWRSDKHVLSNGKPDEILTQVACLKLRYERAADFAIIFAGSIRGFLPTILDEDQVDMSAW